MEQTADLYDFKVTWEPFLLRPGIPEDGVEKPPQYKTVSKTGHLYQAGASVGIDFTGKCERFPNTVLGHQMLDYAKSLDSSMKVQNQVAELIFQAYFTDGLYPNRSQMDSIAEKMTFDMVPYNAYMNSKDNYTRVEQAAIDWRSKVVSGVPFFIINGNSLFSGAQDSDTFIKTFASVAAKN